MKKISYIKINSIISFEYQVYNQDNKLITSGIENNMIVGKDPIYFLGLSNYIVGLDVNIKEHKFNFELQNSENNSITNVVFNLSILKYSDNYNEEYNNIENPLNNEYNNNFDQINSKSKQINKDKIFKKQIINLEKQIINAKKEISILNKNEIILNEKIIEISKKAQEQINTFKDDSKLRHQTEIKELKDFQFQSFFEKILGPLNNLYMAVEFGVKQSENPELVGYVKGFELLINQMFNILSSFGVIPIEPKLGDEFDPKFHNIIELVNSKIYKKDKIVELTSRGYELNNRVIIPANVLVSNSKK